MAVWWPNAASPRTSRGLKSSGSSGSSSTSLFSCLPLLLTFFFFVFTPQDHRHIIINFLIHSFKSIFKPDAVAEAENRRRHGYGGPGFTTSGSSSGHGGDHGSGGPARRPMGRINHSCLFDVLTPRTQSPSKSPFLNPDSVDELPDKRMRLSPHLCVCARRCAVPRVPVRRARHATAQSVHERQVRTQHTHTH